MSITPARGSRTGIAAILSKIYYTTLKPTRLEAIGITITKAVV
ncbi:MAG: hypothetical protein ACLSHU_09400 [Oscillospiraceae bacterium]